MAMSAGVLFGKVMHKRVSPRINAFTYGIFYTVLPLSAVPSMASSKFFGINRAALLSFHAKDHGDRTGSDLRLWIKHILETYNAADIDGEVVLVTMPRLFGYVFNPVSFWLCHDKAGMLRAVLCEVNNTFGETHSYLCLHEDHRPITPDDIFGAEKIFHVSPFMPRTGSYHFRFAVTPDQFGAWIDYEAGATGEKLLTALTGKLEPWSDRALLRALKAYPLVSLRAIFLIHWQAVRLLAKGIRYIPKPEQHPDRLSRGTDITNN